MKIGYLAKVVMVIVIFFLEKTVQAQFLVDMIDTASSEERGLWAIYRKTDHLQISGYFQPQFQVAEAKGAEGFSGGDFAPNANSRFMMRRARIRFDYAHFNEEGLPQAQVVFQFDGTERGVVIRDFWGRIYENEFQLFSFTTGMFARPFGYEINLSSGDREAPERGRMSQILMKTERDLGVMATFEPRKSGSKLRLLKIDLGVFNGQGLTATEEFDSFKDIITRVSLKRINLARSLSMTAGASFYQGGLLQVSPEMFQMTSQNGSKNFILDSSESNVGKKAPRRYRGLDAQFRLKHGWGKTELRTEYWWGVQTGFAEESSTPSIPLNRASYIRKFDGAFLLFLQTIGSEKNQVLVKYDFYDPNREVDGLEIGKENTNFRSGDIRFNTLGFGYLYHFNTHLKALAWYDYVRNEKTSLNGFTGDVKDDVLTLRIQYRF